jgi:hypothetical protein
MFYLWRERYHDRQFKKIITAFDALAAVAHPGFCQLIDKIREEVLCATENLVVYQPVFDSKMEEVEFDDLQQTAASAIQNMEEVVTDLNIESSRQIAEFFKQLRAVNLLMHLDFEELHSLNALPPSLQAYAVDLRWKVPSIWRLRMREKQLKTERKLAALRQDYIPTYFTRIRSAYNGLLVIQCDRVLCNFLQRFSFNRTFRRRIHKIISSFDREAGIKITPSRDEFVDWVRRTMNDVKAAFLHPKQLISDDIILGIYPVYKFESTNPFNVLDRFRNLKGLVEVAFRSIDTAFSYFHSELLHHSTFMRQLIEQTDQGTHFTDVREVERLGETIQHLVNAKEHLTRRPKNLFHKMPESDEATDFLVDMRPTLETAGQYLERGMATLRTRIVNELNNSLFTEVQEKWASVKDKKITASDCRYLEIRMVMYATMSQSVYHAWPEAVPDLKASFYTVMTMYQQLNKDCRYTHSDAILAFNAAADEIGVPHVTMKAEEYEYEEEYEEEDAGDAPAEGTVADKATAAEPEST